MNTEENPIDIQIYNRNVAKALSNINAAIMLSELVNRWEYHEKNKELINHEKLGDGWFYLTSDKVEERTCLTRHEQDTALKILEKNGLIEKCVIGLPAKRHFRLNILKINEISDLNQRI